MAIGIRGLGRDRGLASRVRARVAKSLGRLSVRPVTAQVAFLDDNGPKGGGIRCAVTLRLPYRPPLRVEHTAGMPRLAFDGALVALERQLERYRERQRQGRRRPKKYYAAQRLLG
jgi:ribosome-associated translation inhibitor RaiA